jgi:hypothetical protein
VDLTTANATDRRGVIRGVLWCGAGAAFVVAFAFRWLTLAEFPNDHFDHVAMAQQLLLGALPVRDFTDEGLPLTYILSAAAWALLKSPFLSEAILVASGFAVAAALSFRVAARAAQSTLVAALAVAAQIALYPRTYSYPKLLVQAIAVAIAWWAVERLNAKRIAALAAVTALGYYFRHDHALYLGAAIIALLCVALWSKGFSTVMRATALYAGLVLAFILPHLAYVQWAAGLPTYFAISRQYVKAEAVGGRYRAPTPSLDVHAGLWVVPDTPTVNIRWVPQLDASSRARLEQRYELEAVGQAEETTWTYRVKDPSAANLAAIQSDRRVEDTHGFDRLNRDRGSVFPRLGPGWRVRENSLALLFWLGWLGPIVALALLSARRADMPPIDLARIVMLAVLALCADIGFLRNPLEIRLPDVAVPHTILGAWTLATLWRWHGTAAVGLFRRTLTVSAAATVLIAIALVSHADLLVRESRLLAGPTATMQRWRDVTASLQQRPGPIPSNPSAILLPFFDYVRQCTDRQDRILYAWYAPEIYIIAGRAYAGDHRKFFAPFHALPWEQQRTITRLKEQSVPFVMILSHRRDSFEAGYPDVWRYLQRRYVPMTTIPIDETARMEILRDASWTGTRTYGATGWPCVGSRPRSSGSW